MKMLKWKFPIVNWLKTHTCFNSKLVPLNLNKMISYFQASFWVIILENSNCSNQALLLLHFYAVKSHLPYLWCLVLSRENKFKGDVLNYFGRCKSRKVIKQYWLSPCLLSEQCLPTPKSTSKIHKIPLDKHSTPASLQASSLLQVWM